MQSFPTSFKIQEIAVDGVTIHTRVGGAGPAVLLLHGFADTGDMWAPLAATLARTHTVIVPDLRGMGLSSQPTGGYDKKTQAEDMAYLLDALKIDTAALVTHDIGNMVGYALAAQFPARIARWIVMDAPLPGIGPWDEILKSPLLWHFNFRGPDVERSADGRASFAMPVLAIGADKSFGAAQADVLRFVAQDVTSQIIANSGHWLMEEQPAATMAAITAFLTK